MEPLILWGLRILVAVLAAAFIWMLFDIAKWARESREERAQYRRLRDRLAPGEAQLVKRWYDDTH